MAHSSGLLDCTFPVNRRSSQKTLLKCYMEHRGGSVQCPRYEMDRFSHRFMHVFRLQFNWFKLSGEYRQSSNKLHSKLCARIVGIRKTLRGKGKDNREAKACPSKVDVHDEIYLKILLFEQIPSGLLRRIFRTDYLWNQNVVKSILTILFIEVDREEYLTLINGTKSEISNPDWPITLMVDGSSPSFGSSPQLTDWKRMRIYSKPGLKVVDAGTNSPFTLCSVSESAMGYAWR